MSNVFVIKIKVNAESKEDIFSNWDSVDWTKEHCKVLSIKKVSKSKTKNRKRKSEDTIFNELRKELGEELIEDDGVSVLKKNDDVLC